MPRLLSNLSDAPMLGEAAVLWQLSIQPEKGFVLKRGGNIPTYVYIVLVTVFLFGVWRILDAIWKFREAVHSPEPTVWVPKFQAIAWICFLLAAVAAFATGHEMIGIIAFIIGVMLPVTKREKRPTGTEGWPDEPFPTVAKPTQIEPPANPKA